jgi:hypothetical protein
MKQKIKIIGSKPRIIEQRRIGIRNYDVLSKGQRKPKGWKYEPIRHGLSAKGIKTGKKKYQRHPSRLVFAYTQHRPKRPKGILYSYGYAMERQKIIDMFYFERADKKKYLTPKQRHEMLYLKKKIDQKAMLSKEEIKYINHMHGVIARKKMFRVVYGVQSYIFPYKKQELPSPRQKVEAMVISTPHLHHKHKKKKEPYQRFEVQVIGGRPNEPASTWSPSPSGF